MLARVLLLLLLDLPALAASADAVDEDSPLTPLRYDLQLQLPTASSADPLIPTFFASLRLDFQVTRPLYAGFRSLSSGVVPIADPPNHLKPHGTELRFQARNLEGFENVTLTNDQTSYGVVDVTISDNEVIFTVGEKILNPGRYSIHIDRYVGVITDDKGVFYKDVGGMPAIGTDLFPNFSDQVVPRISGTMKKVSIRLSLIHPRNTIALSNMQREHESFIVHEHWRMTDFVQAANLPPHMFAFLILPELYEKTQVHGKYPLYVYTNRFRQSKMFRDEVVGLAGAVYEAVYRLLEEPLPFTQVNIVFLNEFNGTHSTGLIMLGEETWEEADECHRIEMLAKAFVRQWMGGLATIDSFHEICFQEDVVAFLANKVVAQLTAHHPRSADKYDKFRLSQYVRLQLVETFFAPGESLYFPGEPSSDDISIHCGGKGTQFLESLETVFGASHVLEKIRTLIRSHSYRSFTLESFLQLLRTHIVDGIDLAQIYDFWFHTPGIPNLKLEQINERIRLTQVAVDEKNLTLHPVRIAIRNLTLPVSFMLSQGLELAPLDSKLLPLTNLGYAHVSRVNYNARVWERTLRHLEEAPHVFSARAKAQLLGDFCFFASKGQIGPEENMLKRGFLQLMRSENEHFDLCEFYAFWCVAGKEKKADALTAERRQKLKALWPSVVSVLANRRNYECVSVSNASSVANTLCRTAFGTECL